MDLLSLFGRVNHPRFAHPLRTRRTTVVLEPLFRRERNVIHVDPALPGAAAEVAALRPAVVAGSFERLISLAPELDSPPTHAVVVLTREGGRQIGEADRDRLWRAYHVPVFEQVVDAAGRLIAWECEAHDGLHLAATARAEGVTVIEENTCACGQHGPRVTGPRVATVLSAVFGTGMLPAPEPLASRGRPIPT